MTELEERAKSGAPAVGISIRPARPRDARRYLAAFRSVAAEKRFIQTEVVTRSVGSYRRRFRRPWNDCGAHIVAVDGDRVVGGLSIRRGDHPATAHVATLGMFVVSDHRGRRIGTALMHEGMRWAGAFGLERVELTVYPHNEPAIALYRRFGFVQEGRLVRHAKKSYGYEDEILMAVWLGPEPGREGS